MKLPRRRFLHLAAGAAALPLLPRAARAQAWPTRIVRLVVGFPPGGGADSAARILANRLSEIWGQQVVVENRGGAGGNLGLDTVAHASPDGYTMALATGAPAIYTFLLSSLGYDPAADLAPVSLVGAYPNLMVVSNASPVKSVQEYIATAKADPGKVTFATPGVGTSGHLAGELFKRRAGIEITHVPYRGVAAGGMNDVIAGRVDCMFNTKGSLLQAVRGGQVRGLAVTTAKRFAAAPELPTIAESGVPGFDVFSWFGFFVPAKTPPDVIAKINQARAQGMELSIEDVVDTPVNADREAVHQVFSNLIENAIAERCAHDVFPRHHALFDDDVRHSRIKSGNVQSDGTIDSFPDQEERFGLIEIALVQSAPGFVRAFLVHSLAQRVSSVRATAFVA
jgi:tripartite-type tricarboxylate transporter receptor subunit TctC